MTQVPILPANLGLYTSGVGCAKYVQDPSPVRFVSEWGSCIFEDVRVVVYAFPNQQDRDSFLELLFTSGGSADDIVTQGLVVFVPDSAEKMVSLKQALEM